MPRAILQGMKDADVPWGHALRTASNDMRADVRVTLIKDGDHRLSRDQDLELLWRAVGEFTA